MDSYAKKIEALFRDSAKELGLDLDDYLKMVGRIMPRLVDAGIVRIALDRLVDEGKLTKRGDGDNAVYEIIEDDNSDAEEKP